MADGTTIQALINEAAAGAVVTVWPGTYAIDAVHAPLRLKSDITVDLTGVELVAIPNNQIWSTILVVDGCNNVKILNGIIRGERDAHLASTDADVGGGGAGLIIGGGSRNINVQYTQIHDCFGDGILIYDAYNVGLSAVICDRNRRQGMTVAHVDGLKVDFSKFSNSGGTPPGDGIDFEAELPNQRIANVFVNRCEFFDNEGSCIGLSGVGTFSTIIISGNSFDGKSQPIWVDGNAGSLGTPWWAMLLNRTLGWAPGYRWWGYPRDWSK